MDIIELNKTLSANFAKACIDDQKAKVGMRSAILSYAHAVRALARESKEDRFSPIWLDETADFAGFSKAVLDAVGLKGGDVGAAEKQVCKAGRIALALANGLLVDETKGINVMATQARNALDAAGIVAKGKGGRPRKEDAKGAKGAKGGEGEGGEGEGGETAKLTKDTEHGPTVVTLKGWTPAAIAALIVCTKECPEKLMAAVKQCAADYKAAMEAEDAADAEA